MTCVTCQAVGRANSGAPRRAVSRTTVLKRRRPKKIPSENEKVEKEQGDFFYLRVKLHVFLLHKRLV